MPSVSIGTGGGTIVNANFKRIGIVISNSSSTANLHFTFDGSMPTTSEAYIPPGGSLSISDYRIKHQINGASSTGTVTVNYTEIQQ